MFNGWYILHKLSKFKIKVICTFLVQVICKTKTSCLVNCKMSYLDNRDPLGSSPPITEFFLYFLKLPLKTVQIIFIQIIFVIIISLRLYVTYKSYLSGQRKGVRRLTRTVIRGRIPLARQIKFFKN